MFSFVFVDWLVGCHLFCFSCSLLCLFLLTDKDHFDLSCCSPVSRKSSCSKETGGRRGIGVVSDLNTQSSSRRTNCLGLCRLLHCIALAGRPRHRSPCSCFSSSWMSGCHRGKAKVFVYDLMSLKVTSRTLQGRRLRTEDLRPSCLYFLESRNNKQQDYKIGNCFVAVELAGLTFLAVTYAVDFQNKVLHLWKLKKGKTIDCTCQHPDDDCRTRLCGFTSRYQPMTVGFSVVRFYFLNQLNSTDSVFGLPRDDVYDETSGEYHCSLTNCDSFFTKRDLMPRMVGIELGRRGTGSFQLQLH